MSWGEVQGHDTREAREAKWKECPPLWINLMRDQSWFLALWETWATFLKTKNSWNNMRQAKSCNPKINAFAWGSIRSESGQLHLSGNSMAHSFTKEMVWNCQKYSQQDFNFLTTFSPTLPSRGYAPCQKSLQLRIRPKTASGSSFNRASSAALKIGKCLANSIELWGHKLFSPAPMYLRKLCADACSLHK